MSLKLHSYNAGVPGPGPELKPTWLTTYVAATGVPSGSILAGGDNARQKWTWPGGPVVVRDSPWVDSLGRQSFRAIMLALGVSEPARDAETERYWAKQQEEFDAKHPDREFRKSQQRFRELLRAVPVGVTLSADVLPSMAERMRRTPPAYEAKVNLRLAQPERWLEVPLKPSGWRAHAAHGFRLDAPGATPNRRPVSAAEEGSDQVETARASAELPIVATMPDFLWDQIFAESRWLRDRWREPFFYVVNRAGGEAIVTFGVRFAGA